MSTAFAAPGCQQDSPAAPPQSRGDEVDGFTEPIGIQLPAAGDLPAVTIVLAFNRGATVDGLVEPVGSAVYQALRACPLTIDHLRRGDDATVAFAATDGRISPETPPVDDDAATCLAAALTTGTLSTPPGMTLRVRARLLATEARGVGSP